MILPVFQVFFLYSSNRPNHIKSIIKGFNLKLELEKNTGQKVLRMTNRNEFKNTYKESEATLNHCVVIMFFFIHLRLNN